MKCTEEIKNITCKTNNMSEQNILSYLYESDSFYENKEMPLNKVFAHIYYGGKCSLPTGSRIRCLGIPYYTMIYNPSATTRLNIDGTSVLLPPDSFFFVYPKTCFSYQIIDSHSELYLFLLTGDELRAYLPLLNCTNSSSYYTCENCTETMKHIFFLMLEHIKKTNRNSDLFLSKYIRDLFCEIAYQESDPLIATIPEYIKKCKLILEDSYQQPLTLDELQQILNINKYKLCREFSDYIGTPPMQYLIQFRIKQSEQYLAQTNMSIHDIADAVGIPNTTHFINHFRKYNNMTPLQYRKTTSRDYSL